MSNPIRVAILDDHQAVIDGYLFRLSGAEDLRVVATLVYGEELEPTLQQQAVDVLILDVSVPEGPSNPNPYPLLHLVPKLLEAYPAMNVLVITMHCQRTLVRSILEAGVSGYLLKDDRAAMLDLAAIIRLVHGGSMIYSPQVSSLLKTRPEGGEGLLTARQIEILSFCAAYPELSTAEIARRMNVAHSTVRNLLSSAYLRLEVPNRAAAISKARLLGLITP